MWPTNALLRSFLTSSTSLVSSLLDRIASKEYFCMWGKRRAGWPRRTILCLLLDNLSTRLSTAMLDGAHARIWNRIQISALSSSSQQQLAIECFYLTVDVQMTNNVQVLHNNKVNSLPQFLRDFPNNITILKVWFWRYLTTELIWHLSQSSIRPSIYLSLIVKSRSYPFLEPTST